MAKKELTMSEFREIIREEAMKLKRRIVLENEKKALEAELKSLMNESYMEEVSFEEASMEEGLFGTSSFNKAKNDFAATHKAEIDQMMAAYKKYDPSYIDLSTALVNAAKAELKALATKYGINMQDAYNVLYKDLTTMVQPMDFNTFKRQAAKGGASFGDIAGGASAGRKSWTGE